MKIETSPIIELDNFIALRSKSYSFSYKNAQKTVQKSKQKGIQHTPIYSQFLIQYLILKQQLQLIILFVQMLTT